MRDNGKKKERMAKQKEGVREVSKMKKKKGWGGGEVAASKLRLILH